MKAGIKHCAAAGDSLHVVQITDTHLKQKQGGKLVGVDTDFSLGHVIDLARRDRQQIDLLLGTGDISDHGSEEAYGRAGDYFNDFGVPVVWLPGNHDCAETMARVLGEDGRLVRAAASDHWLVVMLNSQIPGEVGGELGAGELAWLGECLAQASDEGRYVLVCLHHQPVPMGSHWIDEQMVADHEEFFSLLDQHDHVRGVLWGHVHQQLDVERKGVKLMATPSSCIQFAPCSYDFKIDDQPPGYRWLELKADGEIETGVSRVQGITFEVDLDSSGYL